jgi:hypothetical protein
LENQRKISKPKFSGYSWQKKRLNHVLRRICPGKVVYTLTKLMLVRKNFLTPFFLCSEKIFKSWKKIFPPPPPPVRQQFLGKKNSSMGLLKK